MEKVTTLLFFVVLMVILLGVFLLFRGQIGEIMDKFTAMITPEEKEVGEEQYGSQLSLFVSDSDPITTKLTNFFTYFNVNYKHVEIDDSSESINYNVFTFEMNDGESVTKDDLKKAIIDGLKASTSGLEIKDTEETTEASIDNSGTKCLKDLFGLQTYCPNIDDVCIEITGHCCPNGYSYQGESQCCPENELLFGDDKCADVSNLQSLEEKVEYDIEDVTIYPYFDKADIDNVNEEISNNVNFDNDCKLNAVPINPLIYNDGKTSYSGRIKVMVVLYSIDRIFSGYTEVIPMIGFCGE